jgi:hypothetical protein
LGHMSILIPLKLGECGADWYFRRGRDEKRRYHSTNIGRRHGSGRHRSGGRGPGATNTLPRGSGARHGISDCRTSAEPGLCSFDSQVESQQIRRLMPNVTSALRGGRFVRLQEARRRARTKSEHTRRWLACGKGRTCLPGRNPCLGWRYRLEEEEARLRGGRRAGES